MPSFIKAESFKLSKKLKSWLGPLLVMVLVLIAFPLSIDISQYDLDKFYFSIIVVSLLMTAFVATEGMFEEDFEGNSLFDFGFEVRVFIDFLSDVSLQFVLHKVSKRFDDQIFC